MKTATRDTPPDRRVALIRGINVGRAKRIAMADLRAVVEALGYGEVRTLANSGNVVFDVLDRIEATKDDPASRIEAAMEARHGISARVIVITVPELAEAVDKNPFRESRYEPSRLAVVVLVNPSDRKRLQPLTRQEWAPEAIALGKRVAYLWCANGVLESRVFPALTRVVGDAFTARNLATLTKLLALAGRASR